jgi:SAM-dependent methyltransferase
VGDRTDVLREGYDRLAGAHAEHIAGELAGKPFDRELLDRFAALAGPIGTVGDLGCGPGHVAHYLHERGVDVVGIDLSPGMVAEAERLNPGLPFRVGDMTALNVSDGALGGIVAFYSVIHVPRERHQALFAEWRRVLRPGGLLLVSFHIGESDRHVDDLWDIPVSLDFLFFTPEEVVRAIEGVGLAIVDHIVRPPYPEVEVQTERCYVLARKPGGEDASISAASRTSSSQASGE